MAAQRKSRRIGLTGGIGSGKSTVTRYLQDRQIATLDADALARALTTARGAALNAIRSAFGPQAIAPDGGMDRSYMRDLVFSRENARLQLEAILHPLVRAQLLSESQVLENANADLIVWDIPLLVEHLAEWRPLVDQIWVVDCEPATQIDRVVKRSGLSQSQVQAIMAGQCERHVRLAAADAILDNSASMPLAGLHRQVDDLLTQTTL